MKGGSVKMRYIALIISIVLFSYLPAQAGPAAAETVMEGTPNPAVMASPSPAVAPTTIPAPTTKVDPMDPRFKPYYPLSGTEAEKQNRGGEWYRGPYGRMHYHPPVRHQGVTTSTTSGGVTVATKTTSTTNETPNVIVNNHVTVTVTPPTTNPAPTPPDTITTSPKKAAGNGWSLAWLWWGLAILAGGWVIYTAFRTMGTRNGSIVLTVITIVYLIVWLAIR